MIVDFCAYLGHWPLYQLPVSQAPELIRVMDRCGIDLAFVSLAEGAFLLDPREANERIAGLVSNHLDRLLPVGTVDLNAPQWRAELDDALERLKLAGFRLYPTYHHYPLDTEEVIVLATVLAEYRRPLFLAAFIDEERFQHPAIRVPKVRAVDLVHLIRHAPQTTIVLNNLEFEEVLMVLEEPGLSLDNVFIDTNALDKPFNGLSQLVERQGSQRLVFGSQVPFLYPEATLALIQAAGLPSKDIKAILEQNWRTSETFRGLVVGLTGDDIKRRENKDASTGQGPKI
jgi:predicted TIM-barrel fold metal-dependent hydrolase